jgi:tetratricopeptide (TPR) repeat protein
MVTDGHAVTVRVALDPDGTLRSRTWLAGAPLGECVATPPAGLKSCWNDLDRPTAEVDLAAIGKALWRTLFDEQTSRRLVELIDHLPSGTVVDVVFHLATELVGLPVELLRMPSGDLAATVPGVWFTRRIAGVDRPATPPLPGPLKILAAVAAPDETETDNPPLDIEAEMQVLLDAVSDLELGAYDHAQLRILEVASLTEISKALSADQYHVLHLSAHGSAAWVELEDEDGRPVRATVDQLASALHAGERALPLVVLASCRGASGGADGLAATLIRRGADRVIAMQAAVTDGFSTDLARELYRALAGDPDVTVTQALASARRIVTESRQADPHPATTPPPPEFSIPTLLAAGGDTPLRDPDGKRVPLRRMTLPSGGVGVRELPIGQLIGRRPALRTATAVLRGAALDRESAGDWAGVALTGIGGIGKTALAGRLLSRARESGWAIAEHDGSWSPSTLIDSVGDALTGTPHAGLATGLRDPERADAEKLHIVMKLLRQARLLVLFDDFEQNLDVNGGFLDPGFAEIFLAMCAAARTARLLVTCRYPISGTEDTLHRVDLGALSAAELRRLFLRLPSLRELSVDDRRLVARTVGGHPRLLEFLDVLLRSGTTATFRHVTGKLRDLAAKEDIEPARQRVLADGITDAVRLGSRDILLDALLDQLNQRQRELLLQASLAQAPFTVDDLAYTQYADDTTADRLRTVRRDAERLGDLTLLSPVPGDQLIVHPWVASTLDREHTTDERVARHKRGAAMRLHRLASGRGEYDDLVDLIRHLAMSHQYDVAVSVAFDGCDLIDGELGVSALLAETVPLIPPDHARFIELADRECSALLAIGLATATERRYETILAAAEGLVAADPGNVEYQRDLGVRHERFGDLARVLGNTAAAAEHYRADLAIAERLAAADPGNVEYQRDLAISHTKLGDLAGVLGDTAAAAEHFRADLAIAEGLVAADPGNAEFQRGLGMSHGRLGDLARVLGDTIAAAEHFRANLAIAERLVATDPDNAEFQRGLGIVHGRLGDLARASDDTAAAAEHYRANLAIAEGLAVADPGNAEYQRDLAFSHNKLGDLARDVGDTAAAAERFEAAMAIRERLAAADPGNAHYQRDLGMSHGRLGDLARDVGDTTAASKRLEAAMAVHERLAAADPGNAHYQRDLGASHGRLGDLARDVGDTAAAAEHYRADLAITERLAAADPGNADYQRDLSISQQRLARLVAEQERTTGS